MGSATSDAKRTRHGKAISKALKKSSLKEEEPRPKMGYLEIS
jgi:hypothetical protein